MKCQPDKGTSGAQNFTIFCYTTGGHEYTELGEVLDQTLTQILQLERATKTNKATLLIIIITLGDRKLTGYAGYSYYKANKIDVNVSSIVVTVSANQCYL